MFNYMTDEARRVIVLGMEAARTIHHNYLGTEHILLGLQACDGLAAQVLADCGVTHQNAQQKVIELIGQAEVAPVGHLPFTPRAKKVLELAYHEMHRQNQRFIGPVLLLWALLCEGEGVAVQALEGLGTDLAQLKQKTLEAIENEVYTPVAVTIRLPHKEAEPASDSPEREAWLETRVAQLRGVLMQCNEAADAIGDIRSRADSELVKLLREQAQ